MNIDNIKHMLKNLNIILENKEDIISRAIIDSNSGTSEKTSFEIEGLNKFHGKKISFHLFCGVCINANLWDIDCQFYTNTNGSSTTIKYKNAREVTLLDSLAYRFIVSLDKTYKLYDKKTQRNVVYPVLENGGPKWMNPERWEYVEFLIEHLSAIVDADIKGKTTINSVLNKVAKK